MTGDTPIAIPTACYVLPMLGCSCVITATVLLLNRPDADRGLGPRGRWAIALYVCGALLLIGGPVSFLMSTSS